MILGLGAIGIVTLQEEVRTEVGRGLCTGTETHAVVEILTDHRIDRSDIHLTRMLLGTCLHEVLYQRLHTEDDILESLQLLKMMDKLVDRTLALRQFHLSVLIPESIVTHLGVRVFHLFLLTTEQLLGDLLEGKV